MCGSCRLHPRHRRTLECDFLSLLDSRQICNGRSNARRCVGRNACAAQSATIPKKTHFAIPTTDTIQAQPVVESNESFVGERAVAPRFSFLNVSEISATPAARRSAKCTGCDGTGGSADKPAGSLLQPEFLLPKSLNPRLGRRVFYASRQCFVPRAGTTQNSGGTKPFSAPAKTSGNRRWIPIGHQ
jgi:hypothetical protein